MTDAPSVAIVGIGGIFPDAPDLERFWDNIGNARSAAREVPQGRWLLPAEKAFDPEPGKADRVYSRRGCFIDEIPPPVGLDLDPTLLAGLDPLFHLLLAAGSRAFADGVTTPLDRSRIGVIVGNLALPSEHSAILTREWLGRTFEEKLLGRTAAGTAVDPRNRYAAGLPAGILAHALGLGGGHCTLDAACASSLYAIRLAADELISGRADAMLTGGVSRPDPLYTQMGFSQLRALSRRGICSPFDAAGDGLVVGEGAGIFLLKRTEDAVAHGDRIYGIVRSVGLANDVGGSLLAPLSEGQLRAMHSAYLRAGWSPRDVDLIECHATGTPVGDAVEFASLRELWGDERPSGERCVIGSVKSNIGHLLTAAGAAALTKVLLALREESLPPTAGFDTPPVGIDLESSPFRVLTAPSRWERRGEGIPRRAAVSAFGFGGINAHLLVEEWLPKAGRAPKRELKPQAEPIAVVGMDARFGPWRSLRSFRDRVLGNDDATLPVKPTDWWGAQKSGWFRETGLDGSPFAGYRVGEMAIAPDRFRIPPRELEEMLPQQLMMLESAAEAMADAGLGRDDNLKAGVFVGIALDLNSTNFSFRWSMEEKGGAWGEELGDSMSPQESAEWIGRLKDSASPPLTANRTMGALGSVVASRIAREFRFGGPSFTLSSEESSGIRALETAVRLLREGEIDRALVGAVDLAGDLRAVLGRHAVRPFSPSGSSVPFDVSADGGIVGEGAAAVVLKPLEDAVRDGDRIYAVIRGIGDAGGKTGVPGETAYRSALHRAYVDAGVDPATVGYIEADATGDPRSDYMEAAALAQFFTGPPRSCAVGSVAADIGSCGAASGLASFVRASLALHHEIIPGIRNLVSPVSPLDGSGPLHLPRSPRYWLRNRTGGPRRAGVSVCSVDGTCSHVVLEGWDGNAAGPEPVVPPGEESLFVLGGETPQEIAGKLNLLQIEGTGVAGEPLPAFARRWHQRGEEAEKPLAMALVARNTEELAALANLGKEILAGGSDEFVPPSLRDRIFYSGNPLGRDGKIAFVFPGSGNHYPGMGSELSFRRPDLFRRQDGENARLKDQFRPELFWNGAPSGVVSEDHRGVIFGQVAVGCAVSDAVRSFGIEPQGVIGYSLGESAGLFALRTWRDRDLMLERMEESTLFTSDLAGECRAARRAWGLPPEEKVSWLLGVAEAPAGEVRRVLHSAPRVYLLIVNTPDECVIGGDAGEVRRVVAELGCRFFPLEGVTTVHCEVAREVAQPYHDLHLFDTAPPEGMSYYSGARGSSYPVTRESAAASILAQALEGIDYPTTVESAYADGFRIFLEMGPGSSCSRMIGRILAGRPHVARSACHQGQETSASILRLLAQLVAERVPVDLSPLFSVVTAEPSTVPGNAVRVRTGGDDFRPPLPPRKDATAPPQPVAPFVAPAAPASSPRAEGLEPLLREMAAAQEEHLRAHEAYLRFAEGMTKTMTETLALQLSLEAALGDDAAPAAIPAAHAEPKRKIAFERNMCLEFARGSAGRMLGEAFAEADSFPTRVRLPDEPLMLVDRIVSVEGEPKSMTSGGVVTEHDVLPGAWYLDGGRIPTCIAVEAGQADLFLSGYLGIDFITRGLAVYRLLDAVVTFHRGLPRPGETISYDIRIDHFFRQGETHLFRFRFEATVNGEPLLSMRDGCAGFFSAAELDAGKGIVRPALDLRPTTGILPADWREIVPMGRESYDAVRLDRLREGDLAGCFGETFSGLGLTRPLTIPGGRMRLVHRVTEIDPAGGRCGLGLIRAEADIRPDDWFLTCHFVDDRVMPGTLMYECCMHTLRIFLLRMGWVAEADGSAWEPVPGVASQLRCRGQVLETTKVAGYEVTIRELGYSPEPYAIVDALMYADGKPIVEITSMSVRLTGTTREKIEALWRKRRAGELRREVEVGGKPALYTKEQILAYSNGKPSEGFGEPYRIFDEDRRIARLPGPPYQFLDRITGLRGEPWKMVPGAHAEAEYDVPAGEWYFAADRQPRMPFAVLLEVALQPCGWLAAYVGSALTSPTDISFRNLGGIAVQHRPVTPESGTLTAAATMKKVATSGGMIIQEFDFAVSDREGVLYEGETMFGFFSKEALANQVGVRDAALYLPTPEEESRGRSLPYPDGAPFPEKMLRMVDRIELFVPAGGRKGLGYLRGTKDVDPREWFFAAHFYQDPVTPGSLGLEGFLQLVKFAAVERWGWHEGDEIAVVAMERKHSWLYRGQVVPTNSRVTIEATITAVDEAERVITAEGFLAVDGRIIYQMNDFTVRMERQHEV
jgi:acyl transferase domain-containing protein/3-hydroxymyristoyl/3-hydroxydecanoyl-(acyl carrier protein) dehydratase